MGISSWSLLPDTSGWDHTPDVAIDSSSLSERLKFPQPCCRDCEQEALPDETEVIEDPTTEEPVGANPVQVEVGEFEEPTEDVEEIVAENPCQNHHCKHGKVCEVDDNNSPMCVCQDPSSCPAAAGVFEKVCGTDNKTYDSSCHFFATKCTLEGTKKGHKLHLDYIGPCKFIPACLDTELTEFPLRMRDWLKNVLITLYERDEDNNLLTEKQKLKVKKIHENEKRLEAGDHTVELLARDFEKNYNMYIFPVHWQFGQLDQHPIDGYLSHTELAPLRAPLIPMEHCTTRFFEACDLDNDKYIALEEWASCFGIKEQRKPEITTSTGQVMEFSVTVNCTDHPMLSADGLSCLSTTITSTSTFFSFDFWAGIVRTAVMAVTAIRATLPPNTNWTSGKLAKK
ncbi:SPARC [Turdus rufiventris]|nr:SPARC [Turdus rufiventris]